MCSDKTSPNGKGAGVPPTANLLSAREIDSIAQQLADHLRRKAGVRLTCVECYQFDHHSEVCNMFRQRPPARVIAFGCEHFESDDIPF